jgi:hypothetical protein
MWRRLAASALAACAASAGLVVAAGTAQASYPAPKGKQCAVGYLQLSEHRDYRGWNYCINRNNRRLSDNNYGSGEAVGNTASSVVNRYKRYYWALYDGANYTGDRTNSYPNSGDAFLGNDAVGNDKVSSVKRFR